MGLLYGLMQGVGARMDRAYEFMRSAGLALGLLDFGSRQLHAVPANQQIFHPHA
jgi:hypothetical protein